MNDSPIITVIIPTYNYARFLPDAIDSVLAQTFTNYEVIVVDDGSKDNTEEVIQPYLPRIKYIRQQNAGVSTARNRGIAESRGKYITFLDADDTYYRTKLEKQLNLLTSNPDVRACYSDYMLIDVNGNPLQRCQGGDVTASLDTLLLRGNVVGSLCTVCVEKSIFDAVGGFDPQLSQCADWDMWIRIATQTPYLKMDEPLVTYRIHGNSMSTNPGLLERDSRKVLAKGFSMNEITAELRKQQPKALARNFMVLAGSYYHANKYLDAIRCVGVSLGHDPSRITYLLSYPLRLIQRQKSKSAQAQLTARHAR